MSEKITFTVNLDGNIYTGLADVDNILNSVNANVKSSLKLLDKFQSFAFKINNITDFFGKFSETINSAIAPGVALNASLQDLSAITGVTGKGLKEIEGYARQTAKAFGVDASQAVESYKNVLSQLSPELAKSPAALKAMGDSIAILLFGVGFYLRRI